MGEDEPDTDQSKVLLDWYNSDLQLEIDKSSMSAATPLTEGGFAYTWAGARATYGYTMDKVMYEVKIVQHLDVNLEDEPSPHVVRVGWSTQETSMQLGEELNSFGYGGTGKISTDCHFRDYGCRFKEGDVIGSFLDMESRPATISYTVNGKDQGVAFEVKHSTLGERPLFPHVLTKNCSFHVNFGDRLEGQFSNHRSNHRDMMETYQL